MSSTKRARFSTQVFNDAIVANVGERFHLDDNIAAGWSQFLFYENSDAADFYTMCCRRAAQRSTILKVSKGRA